jgi:hypothetical protein
MKKLETVNFSKEKANQHEETIPTNKWSVIKEASSNFTPPFLCAISH